ncbi:hypothetical protein [Dyadobacter flavalbus]|nr:hypothetical protein [Dyadobacter flavalbus]
MIKIYIREGERWYVELYSKMEDVIPLSYFSIEIPVSAIYKKVAF